MASTINTQNLSEFEKNIASKIQACVNQGAFDAAKVLLESITEESEENFSESWKSWFLKTELLYVLSEYKKIHADYNFETDDVFGSEYVNSVYDEFMEPELITLQNVLSEISTFDIEDEFIKFFGASFSEKLKLKDIEVHEHFVKEDDDWNLFFHFEVEFTHKKRLFKQNIAYYFNDDRTWIVFNPWKSSLNIEADNRFFKIGSNGWLVQKVKSNISDSLDNFSSKFSEIVSNKIKDDVNNESVDFSLWNNEYILSYNENEDTVGLRAINLKTELNSNKDQILKSISLAIENSDYLPSFAWNSSGSSEEKLDSEEKISFHDAKVMLLKTIKDLVNQWWNNKVLVSDVYEMFSGLDKDQREEEKEYINTLWASLAEDWILKFRIWKEGPSIIYIEPKLSIEEAKKNIDALKNESKKFYDNIGETARYPENIRDKLDEKILEFTKIMNDTEILETILTSNGEDIILVAKMQKNISALNMTLDEMKTQMEWVEPQDAIAPLGEREKAIEEAKLALKESTETYTSYMNRYSNISEFDQLENEKLNTYFDEIWKSLSEISSAIDNWDLEYALSVQGSVTDSLWRALKILEEQELLDTRNKGLSILNDENEEEKTEQEIAEESLPFNKSLDISQHWYLFPLWSTINMTWALRGALNETSTRLFTLVKEEYTKLTALRDPSPEEIDTLIKFAKILLEEWVSDTPNIVYYCDKIWIWQDIIRNLIENIVPQHITKSISKPFKKDVSLLSKRVSMRFLRQYQGGTIWNEYLHSIDSNILSPLLWSFAKEKLDEDRMLNAVRVVFKKAFQKNWTLITYDENALLNSVALEYFKDDISKKFSEDMGVFDITAWLDTLHNFSMPKLADNIGKAVWTYKEKRIETIYKDGRKGKVWAIIDKILDKTRILKKFKKLRFRKLALKKFQDEDQDDLLMAWNISQTIWMTKENKKTFKFSQVVVENWTSNIQNTKNRLSVRYKTLDDKKWFKTITSNTNQWDDIFQEILKEDGSLLTVQQKISLWWTVMQALIRTMQNRVWRIQWTFQGQEASIFIDWHWNITSTLDGNEFVSTNTIAPLLALKDTEIKKTASLAYIQIISLFRMYKSLMNQKKELIEDLKSSKSFTMKSDIYFENKELKKDSWIVDVRKHLNWAPSRRPVRYIALNEKFKEGGSFYFLDTQTEGGWAIAFYKGKFVYLHTYDQSLWRPEKIPQWYDARYYFDEKNDVFSDFNELMEARKDIVDLADYIDVIQSYTTMIIKKHFSLEEIDKEWTQREFYFMYRNELYCIEGARWTSAWFKISKVTDNDAHTKSWVMNKSLLLQKKVTALTKKIENSGWIRVDVDELEEELKRTKKILSKVDKKELIRSDKANKIWDFYGVNEVDMKIKKTPIKNVSGLLNDLEFTRDVMTAISDSTRNIGHKNSWRWKRMYWKTKSIGSGGMEKWWTAKWLLKSFYEWLRS